MARVSVRNRNAGWTNYCIPDKNIIRNFAPGETKLIDEEELVALQFINGGDAILRDCFIIEDNAMLEQLNMADQEPEYFYTEAEIKVLLESGSIEQLEDALNFAPDGVIDIIKSMAVNLQIPDTRKRKLISEKTGFSIENAIRVNDIMSAEDEPVEEEAKEVKTRKATPIPKEETKPQRKYIVKAADLKNN